MARILIAVVPIYGHVTPMIPLAKALAARGHDVLWSTTETFRAQVEAAGITVARTAHTEDIRTDRGEYVPGGEKLEGIAALRVDLKFGFIDNAPRQLRDLHDAAAEFRPDLVLADTACLAARLFSEETGTPFAVLNVVPMVLTSRDTAPFGLALPPSATLLGRVRNRGLQWLVEHVVFRDVQKHWNKTRRSVGLADSGWLMDAPKSAALYLNPSIPSFEYPRSDLPESVHFIGPVPAPPVADWTPPAWWSEMFTGRPVVHVTQGTIANSEPELIAPAIAALADENVLVVVSTGGADPSGLGLDEVPANVRVERFIPYAELLPHVSAMVTNGGYGGVQLALTYGVPLVVAGATEDKPEVAARVAWSGVGVNLKSAAPHPDRIRFAVRSVLTEPRFTARAAELRAEYAEYDALTLGVEHIERVAGVPALD
ncbi:nucleotide disphospho-sugar-binding domain-containing protein [Nocardia sp. NPDC058658]|uniref:nucleotide disphospho-sugar-binding domain-containing protein n=1 Tax=Nocardia sp. NPDC058658 TaxID=3346580 RepID=UPI0036694BF2